MRAQEKTTLANWIKEMAEGEAVEAVVIGRMGWASAFDGDEADDYNHESVPGYLEMPKNVVVRWSQARVLLDYEFNSGFGAPGCQSVYAWTKSWVIGVSQYDGATAPFRIPRNPTNCVPKMPGGG